MRGFKKFGGVTLGWIAGIFFPAEVDKSKGSFPDIPALVGYEEAGIMLDSRIFTEKLRINSIYKKIIKNRSKTKKGLAKLAKSLLLLVVPTGLEPVSPA